MSCLSISLRQSSKFFHCQLGYYCIFEVVLNVFWTLRGIPEGRARWCKALGALATRDAILFARIHWSANYENLPLYEVLTKYILISEGDVEGDSEGITGIVLLMDDYGACTLAAYSYKSSQ